MGSPTAFPRTLKRGARGLACIVVFGGLSGAWQMREAEAPLDRIARQYVALAQASMQQDPQAASGDTTVPDVHLTASTGRSIATDAADTLSDLERLPADARTDARRRWLRAQLRALAARAAQRAGTALPLQDEMRTLYAVREPPLDRPEHFAQVRQEIERLLPGPGDGAARLDAFEQRVTVPAPRVPAVFERALAECRARTRTRITLPPGEAVSVRYVVGESWSGFSAFLGQGRSEVSVNTGYPLTVDRVLQLACHEGYPGHHAINVLRDTQARAGRPELAAVPLFTPDAFETEVIATHAAALVFTDAERTAFERETLFPLAGLDPALAGTHVAVASLIDRLAPSIGAVLTQYLSGGLGFVEAHWRLQQDALMQHPRATLEFARTYRGFSLAYAGTPVARGGIAAGWLGTAGFPVETGIISGDGHHSPASSYGR